VIPGAFVNTTSTQDKKREALAAHKSQQNWLDVSQGLNCYLLTMEDSSLELGRRSGRFKHAEGWRRHLHVGFGKPDTDPLREVLGCNCLINDDYEEGLG
jgi:LmbE family N-acetylglucosaminyl deacetylase